MKKILLLFFLPFCLYAQRGPVIRNPSNITLSPISLSSNDVYNIAVAAAGTVTGAVLTNEARAVAVTNTGNLLGGSLVAPNGSVSAPSFRFLNDADTGLYSSGSGGTFSVTINNANTWEFGDGAGSRVFRPATDNAYDIGEASKRIANVFAAQVIGDAFIGNGISLTNIPEKNINITTNTWGNTVIDFSRGTQIRTNLASNLTLTGIAGFVDSTLNFQSILMNPSGSTWTLVVPNEWNVSGYFTNGTTVAITNGTIAEFTVKCMVGFYTNATIDMFQP